MTRPARRFVPWPVLVLVLLSGCQACQVAKDGIGLRESLLTMYTDQVVDNLVRAHDGQAFVQLTYRDLLVQDTDSLGGGATAGWSEGSTHTKGAAGLFTSVARNFGHTFGLSSSVGRQKVMSFKADPVTNQNDIYEAYLAFAHNPELFVVCDTPPACPVHCQKKCGKKYYWVPCEAGAAFQELVLKTTLMRGPETAPPGAYEVQISRVSNVEPTGRGDSVAAVVVFSAEVPNSIATMIFKHEGRTVKLPLSPLATTEDGKPLDEGAPTKRLSAQWSPKFRGVSPDDLPNKKARVYSHLYPPEAPTISPVPQQILDTLDRIRANQAITPNP